MLEWLSTNWGTLVVALAVLAAAVAAGYKIRRNKKQGKSSCGGSCGSCPMSGKCHSGGK